MRKQDSYRLARLAGRYGAEIEMIRLLHHLVCDCKLRDVKRTNLYDRCGAHFPDWNGPRPPDVPAARG